jgi:mRNA-degrading endonuclease YafQ of YafQ-DinJ toxin-antitoxin module
MSRAVTRRNPRAAAAIEDVLGKLHEDAFDSRLRTHKLRGRENQWSCTAGYDLRIVFEFVMDQNVESILLLAIGTHDEVY